MKKKYCMIGMIMMIVLSGFPSFGTHAGDEDVPEELSQLYARSAVLMDADSGRVLFGKEEDVVRPMASTTKIMTCILALENMQEDEVTAASDYAASQPKVRLGVKGKEEFRMKDLLYSLMLESHNDSAVVIAEGIAGSVEEFAVMMNEKAAELGCSNTYFVTPNGLDGYDDGGTHSTTARDLAAIMRYCIRESPKKDAFLEVTRTKEYSFTNVKGDRSFSCSNHNSFLTMMDGALSGKTGFTADAGYCYVGALERDGRTFIVALLACGWPNNKGYKWQDTRKLMEYGIANYQYRTVWQDMELKDIKAEKGIKKGDEFGGDAKIPVKVADADKDFKVLLKEGEKVDVACDVSEALAAPVKEGKKVGTVTYMLDGELLREFPVITTESADRKDAGWCAEVLVKKLLMQ
ncbi:D-alanyl-D-alanine carboxypeptidase [Lachnospiraceae bacterium]|uniref:D-alanyl-D-alanine carboxypeptidase family protein n=1 Tax=Extibacter sp. GGCC_0201 TaxID=2731209 RepID=UPI001AA1583F|nr:D-alanyl-D-alanine carboxypeptidase family protein [Extibacter sp. GGCC_0201]BDF34070.1 D-alanyl-D-alanine carboxypeptidase [Lachnospiraceae bacterium]BDF38074.1 D-alanyl-D-alanine carboxypeptidase [Lachnospiraceae bacterium]